MADGWPPRFNITPAGAAGLFLRGRCAEATADTQRDLAALLEAYWEGGYEAGKRATSPLDGYVEVTTMGDTANGERRFVREVP